MITLYAVIRSLSTCTSCSLIQALLTFRSVAVARMRHTSGQFCGDGDVILAVQVQQTEFCEPDRRGAEIAAFHDVHAHVAPDPASPDSHVLRLPISGIAFEDDSGRAERKGRHPRG